MHSSRIFVPLIEITTCSLVFGIEELGHLIEQPFIDPPESSRRPTEPYDVSIPVVTLEETIGKSIQFHLKHGQ